MSDLIKRSDAIKAILQKPAIHGSEGSWYHADDIRDALNAVPSADRPQGKWIEVEEDWRHQIEFWKCSECDFAVSSMYNYCPDCGARMKGADDE